MSNKFVTVFEAIGHYLKELFGDQTEESKINAGIAVVTPIVTAIVDLVSGPGASAAVSAGIAQLKSDYATLCAIVQGSVPVPGESGAFFVTALVSSLSQNLNAILTDAGVKNSANFAKASSYVQFVLSEVQAITTYFVSGKTTTPALPQPAVPVAPPSSASAGVIPTPQKMI